LKLGQKLKTCLIAAPPGTNLEVLLSALAKHEIRVLDRPSAFGEDSFSNFKPSITPDLVIGVLTRARRSDWALFELGVAWGAGSQILIFAPSFILVPQALDRKGVLVIKTQVTNEEAVGFVLDQLTALPEAHQTDAIQRREIPRPLGDRAKRISDGRVKSIIGYNDKELHKVVEEVLRESGVDAIATDAAIQVSPNHIGRADFAVWCDSFGDRVGNPLLIEVTAFTRLRRDALNVAMQLSRQVKAAGARTGLLIFGQSTLDTDSRMPPNVLSISIDELLRRLQVDSFPAIVTEMRNTRARWTAE